MHVRLSALAIWISCLAVTTLASSGCGGGGGEAGGGASGGGAADASPSGGTPDATGNGGGAGGGPNGGGGGGDAPNGGGGGGGGGGGQDGDAADAAPADAAPVPEVCEVGGRRARSRVSARYVGCRADFERLASAPLSSTLPGARSTKVVYDRQGGSDVFYQNSVLYPLHYDFASAHLSGNGRPIVGALADFNASEYFSPDRRFILGAVTYYEGPARWALELSPYDTASAALIEILYRAASAAAFFGPVLAFHPTSDAVAVEAARLPADIPIVTTDELFAGIDYQPLSLGAGVGRLRFVQSQNLENEFLSYDDLVVIDEVPNDITPVRGLISETFQTPLSHVNVLAQNRGTPNMGLRGAMDHTRSSARAGGAARRAHRRRRGLERARGLGRPKRRPSGTRKRPAPVTLPPLDLGPTDLRDHRRRHARARAGESLRDKIRERRAGVRRQVGALLHPAAHGGRAHPARVCRAHVLLRPVHADERLLRPHRGLPGRSGLHGGHRRARDAPWRSCVRTCMSAAVDQGLQTCCASEDGGAVPRPQHPLPHQHQQRGPRRVPLRGLLRVAHGRPDDWNDVLDAIRETYASAWLLRTFEERSFYGVDHETVGMALLVHPNFPDEEANGVAVTNNPFAPVRPGSGVLRQRAAGRRRRGRRAAARGDERSVPLLLHAAEPADVSYLSHSSLVAPGDTVLTGRAGPGARRRPRRHSAPLLRRLRPGRGQRRLVRPRRRVQVRRRGLGRRGARPLGQTGAALPQAGVGRSRLSPPRRTRRSGATPSGRSLRCPGSPCGTRRPPGCAGADRARTARAPRRRAPRGKAPTRSGRRR
jgi:hypothetical protein